MNGSATCCQRRSRKESRRLTETDQSGIAVSSGRAPAPRLLGCLGALAALAPGDDGRGSVAALQARDQAWLAACLEGASPRRLPPGVLATGPAPVLLLQDFADLPPGDAASRLLEALDRLESGGKLVVLPGIPFSAESQTALCTLVDALGLENLHTAAAPGTPSEIWAVACSAALPTLKFSKLAPDTRPSVLYRGMVYGGRGYSNENLGVLRALIPHCHIELETLGIPDDRKGLLDRETRDKLIALQRQTAPRPVDLLYQSCAPPDFDLTTPARYRIARTTFETDRLPDGWLEACLRIDELWVPSQFNRRVFAAAGYPEERIRVLPTGVDTDRYSPDATPLAIRSARGFKFLSVFDWHSRKGPDLLVRAYLEEFRADEDVCLVLKVYQYVDATHSAEEHLSVMIERDLGKRLEDGPPILLLNGLLADRDLPRLYRAADAFVLPSRGEGFGLPYVEALSCECPVIATRWSGQLDFLDDANSELIEVESVAPVSSDTEVELFAGHRWAQPSLGHLRQLMRDVFAHPAEARRKARRGRQEMVAQLDWKPVLQQWSREFDRILAGRKG